MPRISVILPARDAAATLGRAIASIREQTLRDWELIVVDDGSTDGTVAIACEAARVDPRITVRRRAPEGLVAALNAGLAVAGGELIARMDADDEAMPVRLERQAACLDARPDIGLCGCLVEFGGDRVANAGYALHVDWLNTLVTPEAIELNRFVESPFSHPSVMFRRYLVTQFGGYRAGEFPEDYELWLRWLDAGVQMAKVPQVLLRWNDPPLRLSRTDPRYSPECFFRLKAAWIARHLARVGITRRGTPQHRKVWIWGAGRPTRKRAAYLVLEDVQIEGYIDIDLKKTGREIGGRRVVSPAELPPPGSAYILGYVSSRGARDLIRDTLRTKGYIEGGDYLMCA